jgi:hypothetical protein
MKDNFPLSSEKQENVFEKSTMCRAASMRDNIWKKSKTGKRFQFGNENNRYGPQKDVNLKGYN